MGDGDPPPRGADEPIHTIIYNKGCNDQLFSDIQQLKASSVAMIVSIDFHEFTV
jgi:hypothetical protein